MKVPNKAVEPSTSVANLGHWAKFMRLLPALLAAILVSCVQAPFGDSAIAQRLRDTDSVVVHALLSPIEGARDSALISDQSIVREIVKKLQHSVRDQNPVHPTGREDEIVIANFCQCWGEFEIRLLDGDRLLATLSLHHWKHIRSDALTGGFDLEVSTEVIDYLYDVALAALPEYGARIKEPQPASEPTREERGSF